MATPRHAMGEPATLRATVRTRATSLPPAPWKVNGQQLLCTCFSSAMGAMARLQFTEGVLAILVAAASVNLMWEAATSSLEECYEWPFYRQCQMHQGS
mmetsp:Transcript_120940/g.240928  ORF Transcript_120940/g.240928 Transcript_120940/m.240928 type:complete len:98 (-) Transcript_120940:44-337(-)